MLYGREIPLPSTIIIIKPAFLDDPTGPQTELGHWREEARTLRTGAQDASEKLTRANIRASEFHQKYEYIKRHHFFDRNKAIRKIGDYARICKPRKHTLQVNVGIPYEIVEWIDKNQVVARLKSRCVEPETGTINRHINDILPIEYNRADVEQPMERDNPAEDLKIGKERSTKELNGTESSVEMCAERNGKKRERERNWKERVSFLSRSYKF